MFYVIYAGTCLSITGFICEASGILSGVRISTILGTNEVHCLSRRGDN